MKTKVKIIKNMNVKTFINLLKKTSGTDFILLVQDEQDGSIREFLTTETLAKKGYVFEYPLKNIPYWDDYVSVSHGVYYCIMNANREFEVEQTLGVRRVYKLNKGANPRDSVFLDAWDFEKRIDKVIASIL